ncbi:MAG: hypothetical protein KJ734_07325, partial [Chloroflexi bacterium]|nr:hypothetical protein [Chloroflexota bacterium]
LSEECAGYGFYIEKNKGPMDNTWHWLNFLGAIEKDVALQQKIKAAMIQMQLRWEVYVWEKGGLIAQVRPLSDSDSLQWDEENQGESTNISWPDFVDRLKAIETEDGCDLHLCTHMNKEQAMAAGIGLANSVTQVYQALLPVYEASTRRVGSEQT